MKNEVIATVCVWMVRIMDVFLAQNGFAIFGSEYGMAKTHFYCTVSIWRVQSFDMFIASLLISARASSKWCIRWKFIQIWPFAAPAKMKYRILIECTRSIDVAEEQYEQKKLSIIFRALSGRVEWIWMNFLFGIRSTENAYIFIFSHAFTDTARSSQQRLLSYAHWPGNNVSCFYTRNKTISETKKENCRLKFVRCLNCVMMW